MALVLRRNWPALVVMVLAVAHFLRTENPWTVETLCLGVAGLGVLMNVVVIVANGGMPASVTAEEIPEEQRASHRPIDSHTRLRFLADWIDMGWAYYSPGDVLVDLGVYGLIAWLIYSAIR